MRERKQGIENRNRQKCKGNTEQKNFDKALAGRGYVKIKKEVRIEKRVKDQGKENNKKKTAKRKKKREIEKQRGM